MLFRSVAHGAGQLPAGAVSDQYIMTIDLLPTLARRISADLPKLKIDGLDVWPILSWQVGARNPHEGYGNWYAQNELQAVVSGNGEWKLVLPHRYRTLGGRPGGHDGIPAKYENVNLERPQLYNLRTDRAETKDVAAAHPEVVARLEAFAEKCRAELGDTLTQRKGAGTREPGRVEGAAGKKKAKTG